jgi:hypothetical protein
MIDRVARKPRRVGRRDDAFEFGRRFTLAPIAATAVEHAPRGHVVTEPAWDGHRVLATRVGDTVRIVAHDVREWTTTFAAVSRALARLPVTRVALVGVLCALWREPIARMWRFTKTNGITEGLHNKMEVISRRAYGFRNFQNYRCASGRCAANDRGVHETRLAPAF